MSTSNGNWSAPSIRIALVCLASVLTACGGDEAPPAGPDGPGPHEGVEEIVFRVHRTDPDGTERLAWVGTVDGPRPESPEATDLPIVGFRQPFRVEWEADSERAPIVGTRIRASDDPAAPFLPLDAEGNSVWGTDTSFTFANAIPASAIGDLDCDTGPDCPDQRRFDAGVHSLRVLAVDATGEQIDAALGELFYRVNFSPSVEIVRAPGDATGTPYWTAPLVGGGEMRRALVEGDTIPSGARLFYTVRGRDRLFGHVDPDSACCDQRLDDLAPAIRVQARTYAVRDLFGHMQEFQTLFGTLSPDSVLSYVAVPMELELRTRVVDEHRDPSAIATLSFVGGLPPRMQSMWPRDGQEILLRSPAVLPPQGEFGLVYEYTPAIRFWDDIIGDWRLSGTGDPVGGRIYRIALRFEARPHPLVEQIDLPRAAGTTDHVRAFAYELIGEFDPTNQIAQGAGDVADLFVDSPTGASLALEDEDGMEIFVPDGFWTHPELYAAEVVGGNGCLFPDEPGLARLCAMGDRLKRDLGELLLRARARTSSLSTLYAVAPPLPEGGSGTPLYPTDPHRLGRVSPALEQSFAVRMEVEVEGVPTVWPARP